MSMRVGVAAAIAGAGWIALFWPGVVTFDGVDQYRQALTGDLDDWHPPIMAATWRLLIRLGLGGSGPFFAVQTALFFTGLGLLAAALARAGRPRAGWAVLGCALFPPLASWMTCVLKDAQMIACLAAATGVTAHYRLAGRSVPGGARAAVVLLVGYAVLVRANAAFGAVPLALALGQWGGLTRPVARVGAALAGIVLVVALGGSVNHRLLGARPSLVERTLPVFDMAGIATLTDLPTLPGLPVATWSQARARHCYTPVYWDVLGDETRCGALADTLAFDRDPNLSPVQRDWLQLIAAHPLGYAEHRLLHAVSALRLLPPPRQAPAAAPYASQPNGWGVGQPARAAARALQPAAAAIGASPVGAPAWWLIGAFALAAALRRTPPQPARALALGLLLSAFGMEAGLLVVGIASDLRYHLWAAVATGLAAGLLAACEGAPVGWGRRSALALAAGLIALAGLRIAAPATWALAG
ncbi:hypothetical protein [uncultured Sphingomonas sp.]|uniref:hypothetical protein n=1 Tax=uncultured Sphingomonas sp. TaxID=158754 RepID=UPI0035CACA4A